MLAALLGMSAAAAAPSEKTADAGPSRAKIELTEAALKLHRSALLIDGHNDLPWQMRTKTGSSFDRLDIAQPQPALHTDIEWIHASGKIACLIAAATCFARCEERSRQRKS